MTEPSEVESIRRILAAMCPKYDADVPVMLHEFYQRHIEEVLTLARGLTSRSDLAIKHSDVKLATELLGKKKFARPIREEIRDQAKTCNHQPLPDAADKHGLLLPPETQSLTAKNFQVVSDKDLAPDFVL